jgi:hypothetical protein
MRRSKEWKKRHAERVAATRRRRREEWIEQQGRTCARCGVRTDDERPYPAFFWRVDHIDPATKLYEIRDIWTMRAAVREAELAKCQLLCIVCDMWKMIRDGSHAHCEMHVIAHLAKGFREPGDEDIVIDEMEVTMQESIEEPF